MQWFFRGQASRHGFTDRQIEEGDLYQATLRELNEDIEVLAKHVNETMQAAHG